MTSLRRLGDPCRTERESRRTRTAGIVLTAAAVAALSATATPQNDMTAIVASGRAWYAAPEGRADAPGSFEAPLDLATALSSESPVRPGDTLWLHEGTYRGRFDSFLRGTPAAPVIVRRLPGARAVIDSNDGTIRPPDGGLNIKPEAEYSWYWGLEVTNSDSKRASNDAGAFPTDLYRANGVNVYASHVKLINLVIHDVENGLFVGYALRDVEVYGVISYHNGHDAPTTAWGHGLYVQNTSLTEPRLVRDNIAFANFSHGVHAYVGPEGGVNAIHLEGNIAFQNGAISRFRLVRNLLLGGLVKAEQAVVMHNYTYYSRADGENNLGWTTGAPGAVVVGNRFVGGRSALVWGGTGTPLRIADNAFVGLVSPTAFATAYPANVYYNNRRPSDLEYFVRPNRFEPGRAHIVVYNWPLQASVEVDISSAGLRQGGYYELRDVQDLFGAPVLTGRYEGKPLVVPLSSRPVAMPAGNISAPRPVSTLPEFGVFVLTPQVARQR